jgi:hypothetical protein
MIKLAIPVEIITVIAKILMNTSFDTGEGIKTNCGV